MTAPSPSDPARPVISTADDLAEALAQRFLDNAVTGQDAANDELVERIVAWRRDRRD